MSVCIPNTNKDALTENVNGIFKSYGIENGELMTLK